MDVLKYIATTCITMSTYRYTTYAMHINIGNMHQRGMRCNLCLLVKSKKGVYVSAHVTGNAIDFTCDDKTAEEIREIIKAKPLLLPCKVRLEG